MCRGEICIITQASERSTEGPVYAEFASGKCLLVDALSTGALAILAAVLIDGHRTRREIRTTALLAEEARVDAETSARTAGLIANKTYFDRQGSTR